MLQQGVQEFMAYLNEKHERLFAEYEELHRMIMNIISQMGGTCALFFCHMVLGMTSLLLLLQRCLCSIFILFEHINL